MTRNSTLSVVMTEFFAVKVDTNLHPYPHRMLKGRYDTLLAKITNGAESYDRVVNITDPAVYREWKENIDSGENRLYNEIVVYKVENNLVQQCYVEKVHYGRDDNSFQPSAL